MSATVVVPSAQLLQKFGEVAASNPIANIVASKNLKWVTK
jgi:hypothetical protein